MGYRGRRFLIDRIDAQLGSVEKEIKFDKIAIAVSAVVLAVGILLASLSEGKPALMILGIMLSMIGFAVLYGMVSELIADRKKTQSRK